MLKKLFAIALFAFPIIGHAQVTLNAQLPQAGFVQKEQLWNLILVNNNADVLDVSIQMNLQDAITGQVVLTATTGNLLLSKGVKMIKSGDIQPITYNYTASDLSKNYLPMGAYVACYQIINNTSRKETPLAEECIRINIDPLSPPMLNSPSDKSEIESPYPQFTWMPPTPFDMFSSLSYELLVTEVLQGQTPIEAIQYNTAIYSKGNINQAYESYASSFYKLDTGKLYAWQVIAKNGMNYAAKTEVWTFKVAQPSWVKQLIEQTPFIKMKRDNPEKGIAPNGILKLSYNNETTDTTITIHLIDLSAAKKQDLKLEIKVSGGENLIQKDVQKILHTKADKIYEAYIINSRNEKWRMLFEVHEYKDKKVERN
ncbi:MAG: hypothetical protein ABL929_00855 [Ferruginibacter sp.]|nr:hypothetical protein [Ferruginibacter sp.]